MSKKKQLSVYFDAEVEERVEEVMERFGKSKADTIQWLVVGGLHFLELCDKCGLMNYVKTSKKVSSWLKGNLESWKHGISKIKRQMELI